MKVNLIGKKGRSGVGIYTEELRESISQKVDLEFQEAYKILKPQFLNQILLTRFQFQKTAEINHLTTQDLMAGLLLPQDQKIVVTVHDIFPFLEYSGKVYSWMAQRYVKNLQAKADRIIAISEFTKEQLIENTEIEPERIDVIYQGVDLEKFKPKENTPIDNYFLHVGSEIDRKNLQGLIEIFEKIKRKDEETKLIRVGNLSKETKKLIEQSELKLGRDIVYKTDITDEELVNIYSAARKLLFPSHAEGFGRPIIESLACNTSVVAYRKKPMSEILPEKMMVNYNDQDKFVEKALSQNEDNCRKYAKEFTWQRTAEQVIETYERA